MPAEARGSCPITVDRVRVGPFATEEEAKRVAKVLQREEHRMFLNEPPASAVPLQAPGPTTGKAIEAKKK